MDSNSAPTLEAQLAAALGWWREAGVDLAFVDEPQGWLRDPEAPPSLAEPGAQRKEAAAKPAEPPPPAIGGAPADWPQDLAGFAQWWLSEPSLDLGGSGPRVAPRGATEPELMVLVPMPEAGDVDMLLSGKEGVLIANMLAAMRIAPDTAYLAAALPRHMARPDWESLARAELGAILRHHLALVWPRRLLVLGRGILPLLGHDPSQAPAAVKQISIHGAQGAVEVPTLTGFAPDRLLENARQRAMLWRQWLEWTGTDA